MRPAKPEILSKIVTHIRLYGAAPLAEGARTQTYNPRRQESRDANRRYAALWLLTTGPVCASPPRHLNPKVPWLHIQIPELRHYTPEGERDATHELANQARGILGYGWAGLEWPAHLGKHEAPPAGIIEIPYRLTPDQIEELKRRFREAQSDPPTIIRQ